MLAVSLAACGDGGDSPGPSERDRESNNTISADAGNDDATGCEGQDCEDAEDQQVEEVCDGIDNDGDGQVDEVCECVGDDTESCGSSLGECQKGVRTCTNGTWGTCDGGVSPTDEVCDTFDNDCDGEADNLDEPPRWYKDGDGDGFGASDEFREGCTQPGGYYAEGGDCNNSDPAIHPGAEEVCDGADNNCDGTVDEDCGCEAGTSQACGSSVGACQQGSQECTNGAWGACTGQTESSVEVCDDIDNDCDGQTDEDCDADGDGWCDDGRTVTGTPSVCPNGGGDCNDGETSIHPSAEVGACDGVDNDCDGTVDDFQAIPNSSSTFDLGGSNYNALPFPPTLQVARTDDGFCAAGYDSSAGELTVGYFRADGTSQTETIQVAASAFGFNLLDVTAGNGSCVALYYDRVTTGAYNGLVATRWTPGSTGTHRVQIATDAEQRSGYWYAAIHFDTSLNNWRVVYARDNNGVVDLGMKSMASGFLATSSPTGFLAFDTGNTSLGDIEVGPGIRSQDHFTVAWQAANNSIHVGTYHSTSSGSQFTEHPNLHVGSSSIQQNSVRLSLEKISGTVYLAYRDRNTIIEIRKLATNLTNYEYLSLSSGVSSSNPPKYWPRERLSGGGPTTSPFTSRLGWLLDPGLNYMTQFRFGQHGLGNNDFAYNPTNDTLVSIRTDGDILEAVSLPNEPQYRLKVEQYTCY
jgi:hypothetical protein